jgi:hypothetical protein
LAAGIDKPNKAADTKAQKMEVQVMAHFGRQWSIARPVKYRGPMRPRQKRVNLVPLAVERERVRACFRRHHILAAHCFNIK